MIYINYQEHFSVAARKGKINLEMIKKINIGMDVNSVLQIMGKPDVIVPPELKYPFTQYMYDTNNESFAHVMVEFDSLMIVSDTYYPNASRFE